MDKKKLKAFTEAGHALKIDLAHRIQNKLPELEKWFQSYAIEAPLPFYGSVDLRDSGFKIAPVDHNLFPAGFNNICPEDLRAAPGVFRKSIEALSGADTRRVLILAETHTQNRYYLDNLCFLKQILKDAGFECEVGWPPDQKLEAAIDLESFSQGPLRVFPTWVVTETSTLEIRTDRGEKWVPEFILLNNDFSNGYPSELDPVKQPMAPSYSLGWHTRKKSEHFQNYNELVAEFSRILGVDPWIFQVETYGVTDVSFEEGTGIGLVRDYTRKILLQARAEYEKRGLGLIPNVFLKNDHGTYGIGIMTVTQVEELEVLNRRTKNKMSVGKGSVPITDLCIQEGIPTGTLVDRLPAEPVIYLQGCTLIGGFLRTNEKRTTQENLNSQGMVFQKLCMADLRADEDLAPEEAPKPELPTLELVYGWVARISGLATGRELKLHPRRNPNRGAVL